MIFYKFYLIFILNISFVYCRIYDKCTLAKELLNKYQFPKDQISTWICIVEHESNYNTAAENTASHDNGLFQISQIYWCDQAPNKGCNKPCSSFRDDNIDDDVSCVKTIFGDFQKREGNGFKAWTTYDAYCNKDTNDYISNCGL
ncbi:lysozyme C, milk isozyme-like [Diorhabda sublineata]|uniref:lysozyme C, milk isozyme-like n=1 Tax=Diorhabda sublineata TaxID=1163346 RepID=UPI0024E12504|nr:lysozyme C, milk isozyme-like [Diorhabda sublineata]